MQLQSEMLRRNSLHLRNKVHSLLVLHRLTYCFLQELMVILCCVCLGFCCPEGSENMARFWRHMYSTRLDQVKMCKTETSGSDVR